MQRLISKVSHPVATGVRITPAVRDLVARSAAIPRGLAFLNRGPTECVASALGAPVHLVEHARTCLEDGPDRVQLLEEHAAAVQRSRQAWPTSPVHFAPPPRGPEEVVGEAERHPLGVEFLIRGPFETVAVTFGAHPDVVLAARDLLDARGVPAGKPAAGR
jgi:hypothetical protein